MEPLRPYQVSGAETLAGRRKLLLGDEPGLGKTRTALEAARHVGAQRIAVICPAIVRPHWWSEARDMGVQLSFVESYQGISLNARIRETVRRWNPDLLIADEFHFMKHRYAKRTKAILDSDGLARHVLDTGGRVWGLSGTPMPRNPAELFPILKGLYPAYLANRGLGTHTAWLNRFCRYRVGMYGPKIYGAQNVPELKELLAPVLLRRLVRDVAPDLPPLRWGIINIEAPSVIAAQLAESDLDPVTRAALEAGELPPMSDQLARYRHQVGDLKAPVAAELIRDELLAEDGTKKVVFAYHRSVLDKLEVELGKDFSVARIDGSTPTLRREVERRRFIEHAHTRVFLGQVEACATGMDGLQMVAHDAIMVEPDWRSDLNTQAAHRLARMGQTLPVLVRMLSLANTLDTSIVRNHEREVKMVASVTG